MSETSKTNPATEVLTARATAGRRLIGLTAALALGAVLASGMAVARDDDDRDDDHDRGIQTAQARIVSCDDAEIYGTAKLVEEDSEEGVKIVRISMKVRGLTRGKHGVHIHETAECEPCGAAGGHFDPGPFGFSSPDGNHPYHLGDLVNIEARGRKGKGKLNVATTRVTLSDGPLSIFDEDGSAFIIHVDPDTFCPNGAETGCAGGARAACGIIEPTGS